MRILIIHEKARLLGHTNERVSTYKNVFVLEGITMHTGVFYSCMGGMLEQQTTGLTQCRYFSVLHSQCEG